MRQSRLNVNNLFANSLIFPESLPRRGSNPWVSDFGQQSGNVVPVGASQGEEPDMRIDVIFEPNADAATFAELGLLAESYGLGAVWTANILSSRDPFLCFSELARRSTTIRMGPIAISPFELHPVRMANQILTLNEMSNGRANIVIGGGGGSTIAMKLKPDRRTMLPKMVTAVRECVTFLKQISADQPLNFDGETFSVQGYWPDWATPQRPHLYVAASKPKMLQMATSVADGVMGSDIPLQRADEYVGAIRTGLEAQRRPADAFRISNLLPWHVKRDKADAVREARAKVWVRGMLEHWYISTFLDEEDCRCVERDFGNFAKAYMQIAPYFDCIPDRIMDALVQHLTLTGDHNDVDRLIDELKKFREAGFTEFALRLYGDPAESIKLIGERVAPALHP